MAFLSTGFTGRSPPLVFFRLGSADGGMLLGLLFNVTLSSNNLTSSNNNSREDLNAGDQPFFFPTIA